MLSLPLSLIGVVLALLVTRGTINLMSLIGVIMLMGLVAKNAILLLDCARAEEAQGVDREEALMHAGRVRLRPILMTTFALIAGMMPVAIGLGEGGEFYRPMAVAIIGGTVVSTLLTLLVVPSFYDSIEINRVRAGLKFHARAALGNPFFAFISTFFEALLTIIFFRFLYRVVRYLIGFATPSEYSAERAAARAARPRGSLVVRVLRWMMDLFGREHPVERAARLASLATPAGYDPRPKAWQRKRQWQWKWPWNWTRTRAAPLRPNPYAPRPVEAD
jgi:hypothetical protein